MHLLTALVTAFRRAVTLLFFVMYKANICCCCSSDLAFTSAAKTSIFTPKRPSARLIPVTWRNLSWLVFEYDSNLYAPAEALRLRIPEPKLRKEVRNKVGCRRKDTVWFSHKSIPWNWSREIVHLLQLSSPLSPWRYGSFQYLVLI